MAAALGVLVSCGSVKSGEEGVAASRDSKVVVAYVTSWSEVMPDPQYMTHINYAFGHVNESFNGVKIDNEERLRQIVDLRKQKPELKVLLSIGGWGSGRFSEMAANDEYRRAFAADCDRVVKEFALDGIDIDWEYPTSSMANISSSPDDTENFTLLMQDIRAAIGNEKELTLATVASARYIDFKAILPSVDFVNIMAYDMASAPKHHSALYPSGHSGDITSDGAVTAHLKAGVPPSKLVMGMPFYGRGGDGYPSFQDYNKVGIPNILKSGMRWLKCLIWPIRMIRWYLVLRIPVHLPSSVSIFWIKICWEACIGIIAETMSRVICAVR